jgi:flagellar hook-associated protein 1
MSISTFLGLETTLRGLLAQQDALDTTSHNISNANTPGYSRQEAELSAADALQIYGLSTGGPGAIGTGVSVTAFQRVRDTFLDAQYRAQNMQAGYQQTTAQQLDQVQLALAEPSDHGLSAQLAKFWDAWGDVSNNPSDQAARQALVNQGQNLVAAFQTLSTQLQTSKSQASAQYTSLTGPQGQVEQIASQIASLNASIKSSVQIGDQPNDLLDKRDLLLDQLSSLGQVSVTDLGNGSIDVSVGSSALVSDTTSNWSPTWGATLTNPGGQLGALQDLTKAGGTIDTYTATLNTAAKSLADSVNALHSSGTPAGVNFFTYTAGNEAATLAVAVTPAQVVTSTTGAAEANDIALQISELRGGAGDNGYSALVTEIGSDDKDANLQSDNAKALLGAIDSQRQSTSGISMDEEMSNLVRFQRGYQASARAMSTMDQMLDTLINRTGRVGL